MEKNIPTKLPSPCLRCARVKNPRDCENKSCPEWQRWFLDRWEMIRAYFRQQMEQAELRPDGVRIGGNVYTQPERVRNYLGKDPCDGCMCPKDLCTHPCRVKRIWSEAKGDEFL